MCTAGLESVADPLEIHHFSLGLLTPNMVAQGRSWSNGMGVDRGLHNLGDLGPRPLVLWSV